MVSIGYVVAVVGLLIVSVSFNVYAFIKLSPAEQEAKVREWLLWAVIQAEAKFGGGTGKIKLRAVYDMFITKFPWLVKATSFDTFSDMVDDALAEMKDILVNNPKVAEYVASGIDIKVEELLSLIARK